MKKNLFFIFLLTTTFWMRSPAQTIRTLNPLATFGSSGRIEPTSANPLLDTGNNQRGLAADPLTGNLVFVDSHTGSGGSNLVQGSIFVLDGNTGLTNGTLSTNGITGGSWADAGALIADDGTVYVCNQMNSSTTLPLKIYRWPSLTSTDPPTVVFSNTIAPAQRYGVSMDIRGAGTATQIIMGSTPNSTSGTNVVIFTTADGTNFTAHVLGTDATAANFQEGIAFGTGNTFWAKKIGAPLRYMSFDLGASTATTIASFDAAVFPGTLNLGPIAVDSANNLLAAIEVVSGTTGSERVFLFDIANPNRPLLLDIESYNPNNVNASAPPGYLDFNGGKLYSHVINNGLAAFTIDTISTPAPIILTQPPAHTRVISSKQVILSVFAYPATTYQWQKNQIDIPGQTNASIIFNSIQSTNAGTYRVIVSNATDSVTSSDAQVEVVNLADSYHFNTLWTAKPASTNYVTTAAGGTPSERNIAYNALSNQVLVVRSLPASLDYGISVIDASTGRKLYNLNTNGVRTVTSEVSGSNPLYLDGIGVADDGAIYSCNETPNAGGGGVVAGKTFSTNNYFRVYRWANSDSNTLPVEIFEGEPSGQTGNFRWGDVMAVRGSGLNTQILLDNRNNANHYSAILVPIDATMTNWAIKSFFMDEALPWGTSIGRSLDFSSANGFFQKERNAALLKSGFALDNPIPSEDGTFTGFGTTIGGVWLHPTLNIAVGLNLQTTGSGATPDAVNLYESTDLAAPLLISAYNFPQNHLANDNAIGWCVWAGNRLYALIGNNGLMAFELVSGPPSPPIFITQPQDVRVILGSNITLTAAIDSTAVAYWQKDSSDLPGAINLSYSINNAQTNNAGSYRCIATNSFGSATSLVAIVTVERPENNYRLSSLWNIAPGTRDYVTADLSNTPNQRSIAYNAISNQVLVVSRTGAIDGLKIAVLDADSGNFLYQLNTTGGATPISAVGVNNIILLAIDVAQDGAIYAANAAVTSGSGTAEYRLYRWANSDSNTTPVLVFSAEPANQVSNLRWGDSLDVRGSVTNTEVIIDEGNNGNLAAVLKPTDSSMTVFTNFPFSQGYGKGSIGRSIQFGPGNTFWQKRHSTASAPLTPLNLSSYDLTNGTSLIVTQYNGFLSSQATLEIDPAHNLAAGISFASSTNAPDSVALYDVSNFKAPLLIAQYPFMMNQQSNANFIGQAVFAGNKVFAIDGNNGIISFNIVAPVGASLNVAQVGTTVQLSWTDGSYILQGTTNLSLPIIWADLTTAGETNKSESITNGNKFYRLKK